MIIGHSSLALTVEAIQAEIGGSPLFSKAVGHFQRKFLKTRVIALLCGIKMWCQNIGSFVSSQTTRVADRQTDRITSSKTALMRHAV